MYKNWTNSVSGFLVLITEQVAQLRPSKTFTFVLLWKSTPGYMNIGQEGQ